MDRPEKQLGNILQSVVDSCRAELLAIKQSNVALVTKVARLEKGEAASSSKINELEKSGAASQTQRIELEKSNRALRLELTQQNETLSFLQTALTAQQGHHALLCDEFKSVQESHDSSKSTIDTFLPWREAVDKKMANAEAKVDRTAADWNAAQNWQAQMRDQIQRLQETMTTQHDAVMKRIETCEDALKNHTNVRAPTPTAGGTVVGPQPRGSFEVSEPLGRRSPELFYSCQAEEVASSDALAAPVDQTALQHSDMVAPVTQSTIGPEYAGIASSIEKGIVRPGILTIRDHSVRNSSVASSVTFCEEVHPKKKKVSWQEKLQPPVPPFSAVREDAEYQHELIDGNVQPTIEQPGDASAFLTSSKATNRDTRVPKRARLGNCKAQPQIAGSLRAKEYDDEDEIVVASRKTPVMGVPSLSNSAADVPMTDLQHDNEAAASVTEEKTSIQSVREEMTPVPALLSEVKPTPIVLLPKAFDLRAKAVGANKALDMDSDHVTLSDIHKVFSLGNGRKEGKSPEDEEVEMVDATSYNDIRRSGRGPKPKRQRDDEVGSKDAEFLHAGEDAQERKKRSGKATKTKKSMKRQTSVDEDQEAGRDESRVSPELGMDM